MSQDGSTSAELSLAIGRQPCSSYLPNFIDGQEILSHYSRLLYEITSPTRKNTLQFIASRKLSAVEIDPPFTNWIIRANLGHTIPGNQL